MAQQNESESRQSGGSESTGRRLISKPEWIVAFERGLGSSVPLHPNWISGLKLFLVTPALAWILFQDTELDGRSVLILSLIALFAALDYLDGVVARARDLESRFGRFFDRLTDYPLLLLLSWFCLDRLPQTPVILKLVLDFLLLALYLGGKGSSENRLRTGISYSTLFSLLFVSQGWLPKILNSDVVEALLWINIAFNLLVVLFNLRVLQKRFIADALSGSNLLCGIGSIYFAYRGQPEVSLLLLFLGAAFDGFDGAAARRWGGTRFGVYSDDIADGVNYGVAPGFALYFTLGGVEGIVIGLAYSIFTISRLVFFTLAKSEDGDPNYFAGVPSTVGGITALCAVILFSDQPALVGMLVGIACAQMVAFASQYRHVGRWMGEAKHRRQAFYFAPVYILVLLVGAKLWGKEVPVALILATNLLYGFLPMVKAFRSVIGSKEA